MDKMVQRTASKMFQKKNSSHVTWSHYKFDRMQQTKPKRRTKREGKQKTWICLRFWWIFTYKWTLCVCEMRRAHFKRTNDSFFFLLLFNCLNQTLFWSLLVFDFMRIYRCILSLSFFRYSILESVLLFHRYRRVYPKPKSLNAFNDCRSFRNQITGAIIPISENNWMGIYPINCECDRKYRNSSELSFFSGK